MTYDEKKLKFAKVSYELAKIGYVIKANNICCKICSIKNAEEADKLIDSLKDMKDALGELQSDIEYYEQAVVRHGQN